jgi:hypothetical protein
MKPAYLIAIATLCIGCGGGSSSHHTSKTPGAATRSTEVRRAQTEHSSAPDREVPLARLHLSLKEATR